MLSLIIAILNIAIFNHKPPDILLGEPGFSDDTLKTTP